MQILYKCYLKLFQSSICGDLKQYIYLNATLLFL